MTISIRNNIASLKVGRQLDRSSQELATSSERLSSGLRINRASDDAAGLALSSQLEADSRIFNRAKQNLNDGISLLSIADGALNEVSSLLTRMAELSQQAANGSFSEQQRESLNQEYQALDQEIRRIEATTEFNGLQILGSGEFESSDDIILDGNFLGPPTLGTVSQNGRYVDAYLGAIAADTFSVVDTQTGQAYGFNFSNDTELGALSNQDILAITNDGVAIIGADSASGTNLYSYELETGTVIRLTDGQTADTLSLGSLKISADQTTIGFSSQTLYDNGGQGTSSSGANGSYRLYSLNLESGEIRGNGQDLANRINEVELSANGDQIAYTTVGASTSLYYADYSSTPSSASLLNTDLGFSSSNLSITGVRDSGEVLFSSSSDVLGNGNSNNQFFTASLSENSVAQLTEFEVNFGLRNAILSSDGSTIQFVNQADYIGENPDGKYQLYRFDTSLAELVQLSNRDSSDATLSNVRPTSSNSFFATDGTGYDLVEVNTEESDSRFDFEAGFGDEGNIITAVNSLRDALSFLGNTTISSQTSARSAFDEVNGGIASLSDLRGKLGAGLSRLEVAQQVTKAQKVEYDAANSRLVDADIAQESANLVRLGILQQTSAALLSQTNQQPALALSLLRG